MNHVPYARRFAEKGVRITISKRLHAIKRDGNGLKAQLISDYAPGIIEEIETGQVVVEDGTMPMDDLYFALKPLSRNGGAVDYTALIARKPPLPRTNGEGGFDLLRIGDAIHARNIHAAIYDALRYCSLM